MTTHPTRRAKPPSLLSLQTFLGPELNLDRSFQAWLDARVCVKVMMAQDRVIRNQGRRAHVSGGFIAERGRQKARPEHVHGRTCNTVTCKATVHVRFLPEA